MTDRRFLLAVEFRERAAERRIQENRIVAETVRATRFGDDFPFDGAARFEKNLIAIC